MARLDLRIKESGKDSLRIELGGRGRLLYLFIFLFLSTAVFLSIDFSYDFTSERIGGTIFTFLLILLSLAVTLTVRSFSIDKSTGILKKQIGLPFGLYNHVTQSWKLGSKPKFIIKASSAIQAQQQVSSGPFHNTLGTAMAKSKIKVKLSLETEESTVILCEGKSSAEVNSAAQYLSAYLGFPVITEN